MTSSFPTLPFEAPVTLMASTPGEPALPANGDAGMPDFADHLGAQIQPDNGSRPGQQPVVGPTPGRTPPAINPSAPQISATTYPGNWISVSPFIELPTTGTTETTETTDSAEPETDEGSDASDQDESEIAATDAAAVVPVMVQQGTLLPACPALAIAPPLPRIESGRPTSTRQSLESNAPTPTPVMPMATGPSRPMTASVPRANYGISPRPLAPQTASLHPPTESAPALEPAIPTASGSAPARGLATLTSADPAPALEPALPATFEAAPTSAERPARFPEPRRSEIDASFASPVAAGSETPQSTATTGITAHAEATVQLGAAAPEVGKPSTTPTEQRSSLARQAPADTQPQVHLQTEVRSIHPELVIERGTSTAVVTTLQAMATSIPSLREVPAPGRTSNPLPSAPGRAGEGEHSLETVGQSNATEPAPTSDWLSSGFGWRERGMAVADVIQRMKLTSKETQTTPHVEKELPVGTAVREVSEPVITDADPARNISRLHLDRHGVLSLEIKAWEWLNSRPADPANAASLDLAAPQIVDAAPHLERVGQMIAREVSVIRDISADSLTVVLKPEAGMEMVLHLAHKDGQVEAFVRCGSEAFEHFRQDWPQLQESLAQMNVKLLPLKENPTPTYQQQPDVREFASSFTNSGSSRHQFGTPQSGHEHGAAPHSNGPSVPAQKPKAARARRAVQGWESWA